MGNREREGGRGLVISSVFVQLSFVNTLCFYVVDRTMYHVCEVHNIYSLFIIV